MTIPGIVTSTNATRALVLRTLSRFACRTAISKNAGDVGRSLPFTSATAFAEGAASAPVLIMSASRVRRQPVWRSP
jgi:hypothetical protein